MLEVEGWRKRGEAEGKEKVLGLESECRALKDELRKKD
jgi:hypothetical protein